MWIMLAWGCTGPVDPAAALPRWPQRETVLIDDFEGEIWPGDFSEDAAIMVFQDPYTTQSLWILDAKIGTLVEVDVGVNRSSVRMSVGGERLGYALTSGPVRTWAWDDPTPVVLGPEAFSEIVVTPDLAAVRIPFEYGSHTVVWDGVQLDALDEGSTPLPQRYDRQHLVVKVPSGVWIQGPRFTGHILPLVHVRDLQLTDTHWVGFGYGEIWTASLAGGDPLLRTLPDDDGFEPQHVDPRGILFRETGSSLLQEVDPLNGAVEAVSGGYTPPVVPATGEAYLDLTGATSRWRPSEGLTAVGSSGPFFVVDGPEAVLVAHDNGDHTLVPRDGGDPTPLGDIASAAPLPDGDWLVRPLPVGDDIAPVIRWSDGVETQVVAASNGLFGPIIGLPDGDGTQLVDPDGVPIHFVDEGTIWMAFYFGDAVIIGSVHASGARLTAVPAP